MTKMAATTSAPYTPAWRAGLNPRHAYPRRLVEAEDGEAREIAIRIDLLYAVLWRGEQMEIPFCVRFCVCWPKGRLTFSDSRERKTGTAGSTGLWGTRPPSKAGQYHSLTPTAWVAETSRLIGSERAWKIIGFLSGLTSATWKVEVARLPAIERIVWRETGKPEKMLIHLLDG